MKRKKDVSAEEVLDSDDKIITVQETEKEELYKKAEKLGINKDNLDLGLAINYEEMKRAILSGYKLKFKE